MSRFLTLAALALVLAAPALHAQAVPTTISYQGVLTDAAGVPVPDDAYTVTLRLFTAASGGSTTYAEDHAVTTAGGVFAVPLGGGTPVTGTWTNVNFDVGYWLETAVGATTLAPRTTLLTSSYARSLTPGARIGVPSSGSALVAAGVIETTAGGVKYPDGTTQTSAAQAFALPYTATASTPSYLFDLTNTNASGRGIQAVVTGTVGVHGESAASTGAGISGEATSTTGVSYGGFFRSASTSGQAVFAQATASSGTTYGVYGTTVSPTGRGVYGTGGTYGGYFESAAPTGAGVYGEATSSTGTSYGGYFRSNSTSGQAVVGQATASSGTTYGVRATNASTGGTAVYGTATATTGSPYGGTFTSAGTSGRGVLGSASGATAIGVQGVASATSGTSYGGYFEAASTSGRGVVGEAEATSGVNYGVYGTSASTGGTAVYGAATATTGSPYGGTFTSAGTSGRGVLGSASGATAIGVQGVASATSGASYGGYFEAASTSGRGVVGEAEATSGINYGVYGTSSSASGYGLYATNLNGGFAARFAANTRFDANMEFYEGGLTDMRVQIDVDEGGDAPSLKLRRADVTVLELDADHNGNARVITEELEITGGSDLAEHFDVTRLEGHGAPLPGMVVSIDPANPGRLTVSASPYDALVAGIVSGAGDVRTGFVMGQRGSIADGDYPVALVGRVYVFVDASFGPVRAGDLLTTSATAGHAMRAADRERAPGAVLGKAMTGLESGRGLVLVLVSLQ